MARICAGFLRGRVTLDARANKIAIDEAAANANGVVTPAERARRGEERRTSRASFRKKHNVRGAPAAGN